MSIGDTDFGVQVGIGFVGRVVTMGVAFLGAIVLARALGPEGYGSFYLLMAIVSFLDNPVSGWANACRKRLTEEKFPSDEAIGSTLLGIAVSVVLVVALARLLAGPIAAFTDLPDGWLLLSALYAGAAVYLTTLEVLKATARFGSSDWTMAARDIVRVVVQIGLVSAGFGVAGMVGGMVFANLLVAPVVLYLLGVQPAAPSGETLRKTWTFARSSIPTGLFQTAQNKMDVILLGALATTGIVGNYEVSLRITMPAMFVAGVASSGLMGRVSNRLSKGQDVAVDIQRNLSYASVVAVPLFAGAATIGGPVVVTVFGGEYDGSSAFVAGLALFHVFRTQKVILQATVDGFDRPDLNLRYSLTVFAVNLVAGVALLLLVGPVGVVFATVASEALGYGLFARAVKHLEPSVSLLPRPLVDQLASAAVMAGGVVAARYTLGLGSWQHVVGIVALGGVVYGATLLAISTQFRDTLRAVAADAGVL